MPFYPSENRSILQFIDCWKSNFNCISVAELTWRFKRLWVLFPLVSIKISGEPLAHYWRCYHSGETWDQVSVYLVLDLNNPAEIFTIAVLSCILANNYPQINIVQNRLSGLCHFAVHVSYIAFQKYLIGHKDHWYIWQSQKGGTLTFLIPTYSATNKFLYQNV